METNLSTRGVRFTPRCRSTPPIASDIRCQISGVRWLAGLSHPLLQAVTPADDDEGSLNAGG